MSDLWIEVIDLDNEDTDIHYYEGDLFLGMRDLLNEMNKEFKAGQSLRLTLVDKKDVPNE